MRFLKTRTVWRIHSVLGLICGLPLLLIAVTGSTLVFKPELEHLVQPDLAYSEPTPEGRLAYDLLRERVNEQLPEYVFLGWETYDDPSRSDKITLVEYASSGGLDAYLNPYTGEVKGTPKEEEARLLGWIRKLHYTFLAGHPGMMITGLLAILMMLLGISGFVIYRKFWASLFTFRWRTSWRLFAGNLHKRIGVISAPIVFILGLSGAWLNIPHAYRVITHEWEHGKASPQFVGGKIGEDVSLDALVAQAKEDLPGFQTNFIRLPNMDGRPILFFGAVEGDSSFRSRYASMVIYNATDGELRATMPITEAPILDQIEDAFFPLHFGTFGGMFTRILYCVVGSAPAFLALSGTYVWWARTRQARASRKRGRVTSALSAEPAEAASKSRETADVGR